MSTDTLDLRNFDVSTIRADFPILANEVNGKPLVYLDNAATSQKPLQVINAISNYYQTDNSNVHRGLHTLSQRATDQFENARRKVKTFINARLEEEIVWVRGTTEAINLVANSYALPRLNEGDNILLSGMEHHSNIVPWQMIAEKKGAEIRVIPVSDNGELIVETLDSLIDSRTKMVAIIHQSNVLGTVNPVKDIIAIAHQKQVPVLLDGAQSVPHLKVDVQDLDCDFLTISGHKMLGPTGIGALYIRKEIAEHMPPYHGGGEMIDRVTFEKTTYNHPPFRFEAGTPNIAGAIGLGAAIDYMMNIGIDNIYSAEHALLDDATEKIKKLDGITIIGTAPSKGAVISFLMEGIHPSDIGTILDQEGIAIRTGHHCAQPLMSRFSIPGTARASFSFYNTVQEVDHFISGLKKVQNLFG